MAHTYIAGEDEGRLASAAQHLGLDAEAEGRRPKKSWGAILFNDNTLTAARMHSVGYLGNDAAVTTATAHHPPTLYEEVDFPVQDDEEVVDMVEGGSLGAAAFGIVKGTVGPAILYLPRGFYSSGYAVAIPAMMFATSMFVFNAYRLLECWKVESDKNHQLENRLKEVQSFLQQAGGASPNIGGGVTAAADSLNPLRGKRRPQYGAASVEQDFLFQPKLLTYPELAKRALGPYSVVVEVGIALFQFGVCLTYLIFVPDNLYQCVYGLFGVYIPKFWLLAMMIVVEIPLSWIRDIRKLTPTNVVASMLIAFGLLAVLVIAFLEGTETVYDHTTEREEWVFWQNLQTLQPATESWFLFIGTSFFMMEGSITLIVPLQEAVYRPEDRAKFPDMNCTVTSWICAFYIVFSAIACAAFGSHIQTALTASLQGKLATIVQLAYSVAVILTFPLQAFPAMEVALRMLHQVCGPSSGSQPQPHSEKDGKADNTRNIFATCIVLVLGVIAVCAIDYLGNVVSILGSLFGIPLALVFPPLMHNQLVKDSSPTTRAINYGVVVVGFFAMAAASFNTIVTWDQGAEG